MRPVSADLRRALCAHVAEVGPIGFDEFVDHALYAPGHGFYQRGGGAGRRRDFLTSPEVGPLFGAVLARALDGWWAELGRPDPFVVVEAGAGPGTLARSVRAAAPACGDALDLVLVEVGQAQWAMHPEGVRTLDALPAPGALGPGPVVVLANELLDNLPFALVERTATGFGRVGAAGLMTGSGLSQLVWRDGKAYFVARAGEQPATDEQVAALRSFSSDLERTLRAC